MGGVFGVVCDSASGSHFWKEFDRANFVPKFPQVHRCSTFDKTQACCRIIKWHLELQAVAADLADEVGGEVGDGVISVVPPEDAGEVEEEEVASEVEASLNVGETEEVEEEVGVLGVDAVGVEEVQEVVQMLSSSHTGIPVSSSQRARTPCW